MIPCTVVASCDRGAEYAVSIASVVSAAGVTIRGAATIERNACRLHANALDDQGLVVRAVRIGGLADYMRAMRAAKKDRGECIECKSPAVAGQRRCQRHRAAHAAETRRRAR